MAQSDYVPGQQSERDDWYENLDEEIEAIALALGIPQADIDALRALVQAARTAYTDKGNAETAYRAAVETYKTADKAAQKGSRDMLQRLKKTPGWTSTMEDTLQAKGSESTFDPDTAQPELQLKIVGGNKVEANFHVPEEVDAVDIYFRPKGASTWAFAVTDTNTPYVHSVQVSTPGQPEAFEYRGIYVIDNEHIGLYSEVASIIVPE